MNLSWGNFRWMFLRLFCRAPSMISSLIDIHIF
jgi:hypothetical protein